MELNAILAHKYFFICSYNGAAYSGWQSQKNGSGVQEAIEDALTQIAKSRIIIHGCGRTDAGVHGSNYVFHALIPEAISDLKDKLNRTLPPTISIKNIVSVLYKANAQKDAVLRTYTYYVHFEKDPYLSQFSTWYPDVEMDFNKVEAACKLIEYTTDFRNFCLNPDQHKSTHCKMESVELFIHPSNNRIAIRFSGNHFLRSMIRLLVGELLEVGKGRTSLKEFEKHLLLKADKKKHHKAYPQGLHLTAVQYPYLKTPIPASPF